MTEIHAAPIDVHVPDDLTIPQFFLDSAHSLRPKRPLDVPWMIEDETGRRIGYEELRARTYGLANALSMRYGIEEDEVVVVFSPNHVDYAPVVWAIHRLGAIVSTANPTYTADELVYQIELTKATTIIAHSTSLEVAADAARQTGIPPERIVIIGDGSLRQFACVDGLVNEGLTARQHFVERKLAPGEGKTKLAFLNFSSGTTGRPKAVMIPHYAPIANTIQIALHARVGDISRPWDKQRFRPGDVVSAVLPFYHIYGLAIIIHSMIFFGVTLVVAPKFNFIDFLDSVSRHRITHLLVVPPIAVLLCKQDIVTKYDFSHVHYIVSGAAPLSGELMAQLADRFPNAQIGQGYGLTETSTSVCMFSPDQKIGIVGGSGTLVPGIIARVVRPDGSLAGVNEPGELWLKSPALALGYYKNPEATRETFVDGWLRTGDEVRIDKDGEVFVLDRLKELIKVRGFQVAPAELEGTLLMHPDVVDACVIPLPDEYSGEVPMAYVVLRPEVDDRVRRDPAEATRVKEEIIKHAAEKKVAYKRLAGGVEFTDVIPKNPSGKILRRVLRDRAKEKLATMRSKL